MYRSSSMRGTLLLLARNPRANRSPFVSRRNDSLVTADRCVALHAPAFSFQALRCCLSIAHAARASRNARYSSSSDPRFRLLTSTDDPLANVESIEAPPSRARSSSLSFSLSLSLSLSLSDLVLRSRFLFLLYLRSLACSRIRRS